METEEGLLPASVALGTGESRIPRELEARPDHPGSRRKERGPVQLRFPTPGAVGRKQYVCAESLCIFYFIKLIESSICGMYDIL